MDSRPEDRKPEKSPLYKFFANPYAQGVGVLIALAVAFSGKLDHDGTIVCIVLGGIIGLFGIWSHINRKPLRVIAMVVYAIAIAIFALYLTAKPNEVAANNAASVNSSQQSSPPTSSQSSQPQAGGQTSTQQQPTNPSSSPATKTKKRKAKAAAPAAVSTSGDKSPAVGSITQGDHSIVQFGDNSNATINPSPDPMDDVFRHLTASAEVPHNNNPFDTKFTIRNGGSVEIQREVFCEPILFVTGGNAGRFGNIHESVPSGGLTLPPGNADTGRCLQILRVDTPSLPDCMDTKVTIIFSLRDHPEKSRKKAFRFLGIPSNGAFEWSEQSPESVESYCEPYVRKPITKIQSEDVPTVDLPEPLRSLYVRGRDLAFACETLREGQPIWPQAKIHSAQELKAEIIKWKDTMAQTLTEDARSRWVSQFGWYPDPGTDSLDTYCQNLDRNGPMLNFVRVLRLPS